MKLYTEELQSQKLCNKEPGLRNGSSTRDQDTQFSMRIMAGRNQPCLCSFDFYALWTLGVGQHALTGRLTLSDQALEKDWGRSILSPKWAARPCGRITALKPLCHLLCSSHLLTHFLSLAISCWQHTGIQPVSPLYASCYPQLLQSIAPLAAIPPHSFLFNKPQPHACSLSGFDWSQLKLPDRLRSQGLRANWSLSAPSAATCLFCS